MSVTRTLAILKPDLLRMGPQVRSDVLEMMIKHSLTPLGNLICELEALNYSPQGHPSLGPRTSERILSRPSREVLPYPVGEQYGLRLKNPK